MIIDMDPVSHGGDSCFVAGKPFPASGTSRFRELQKEFMELTVSRRAAEQPAQPADACKHGLVAEHYSLGYVKFLSRAAIPAAKPFVIPAGADAKDAAPFGEWHAIELAIREGLTNEGVPHLRPVVLRYAAYFFSSAHS